MTALLGASAALLTYNFKDNCCFKADHAAAALVGAEPIYQLYGKPDHLRTHVNHDPAITTMGSTTGSSFTASSRISFFADRST